MSALLSIAGIEVTRALDGSIRYVGGLMIDADGANGQTAGIAAYAPLGHRALDYLGNAGKPGDWWALACDSEGHPYIQGESDPAPGAYISTTALENPLYPRRDPRRYPDSAGIPFIVVPGRRFEEFGVRLGDAATVRNLQTGATCEAIVADSGPRNKLGEGSIALAKALGINPDPRAGGTEKRIIEYRIRPGVKSPLWPLNSGGLAAILAQTAVPLPPTPPAPTPRTIADVVGNVGAGLANS